MNAPLQFQTAVGTCSRARIRSALVDATVMAVAAVRVAIHLAFLMREPLEKWKLSKMATD